MLFKRQLLLNSTLLLLCGPFVDGSGDPLGEARDLDCYMNVFNINNYLKKKHSNNVQDKPYTSGGCIEPSATMTSP